MQVVFDVAVAVFFFALAIFIHELGHFLVARWCGLQVDAFSIGFGPALWKRKINGVVYRIGVLPLGGYVSLPQLDPSGQALQSKEEGAERTLPRVAPWRKILVSLAGVTGNVILAFLFAVIIWWHGRPAQPSEVNTIVGYVATNSAAHEAGLRIGDEIVSVNGQSVKNWTDILLATSLATNADLEVKSPDGARRMTLGTARLSIGGRVIPGVDSMNVAVAMVIERESPAEAAGIRSGDRFLEVAGEKVISQSHMADVISRHEGREVEVLVRRRTGEEVRLTVRPAFDPENRRARIGIMYDSSATDSDLIVHPAPLAQLNEAAQPVFRLLKALVTPKEAKHAAGAIGGPGTIMVFLWYNVQKGIIMILWTMIMININLAILNLLPLPVLDGGHIIVSIYEWVTGKQPKPALINWLWNATAILLLSLMLYLIVFRDSKLVRTLMRDKSSNLTTRTNVFPGAVTGAVPERASP